LRALGILHLLFERSAECFEIRFEEPDVATHYAEMGNLLPLDPKIHGLRAHSKKIGSFWYRPGLLVDVLGVWIFISTKVFFFIVFLWRRPRACCYRSEAERFFVAPPPEAFITVCRA